MADRGKRFSRLATYMRVRSVAFHFRRANLFVGVHLAGVSRSKRAQRLPDEAILIAMLTSMSSLPQKGHFDTQADDSVEIGYL